MRNFLVTGMLLTLTMTVQAEQASAQSGKGCAKETLARFEQAVDIAVAVSSNSEACLGAVKHMRTTLSTDSSTSSVCQVARTMAIGVRQLNECRPGNFSSELIQPVIAGGREDEGESCGSFGFIENAATGSVNLMGGPGNGFPVRERLSPGTEVLLCGIDKSGKWESIIIAVDDECLSGYEGPSRSPYQGHCISGWVPINAVQMTAG